jgi:hypothetical protein
MSEHGEIGFLPDAPAADSCFDEAANCDIGILIVGKRYGDIYHDGASVTHLEYRRLKDSGIPIVTLVENDLLAYQQLFEANKSIGLSFPGMDNPAKTFDLIGEIKASPKNNGVAEFTHIDDARSYIRAQLAHLFGNLLRKHEEDPVKGEVRDILAEVRALRAELKADDKGNQTETINFLRVSRALLDDIRKQYKDFLFCLLGGADAAAKAIIGYQSTDDLLKGYRCSVTLFESVEALRAETEKDDYSKQPHRASWWSDMRTAMQVGGEKGGAGWAVFAGRRVLLTKSALTLFEEDHAAFREVISG